MTLGTSIATRIYLSDSRFPVKPSEDTVVALGYQWRHQEKQPEDTVVALGYK